MRTIDDLRRSFEQHAELAGEPRGLVQAAREGAVRIRRRRRMIRAGVSAAVVLVLAVTVPLAVTRNLAHEKQIPAAPAGRQFGQVTVGLDPASRYAVGMTTVGATRQEAQAWPQGPRSSPPNAVDPSVQIVVFDPGAFHTGSLPGAEPVTVAGHDAWFQPAFPLGELSDTPPDDARGPAVGWADRSGAQVVLYQRSGAAGQKAVLLRVAEGVRIGPPRDLTVPVRVGWLPAGLAITGVTQRSGLDTIVTLRRDDAEVRLWVTPRSQVYPNGPKRTELTVAGRWAFFTGDAETIRLSIPQYGTCGLILETTDQDRTTKADFVRILESLTVADCADRTTWTRLDR